jgi:hypothetical protein
MRLDRLDEPSRQFVVALLDLPDAQPPRKPRQAPSNTRTDRRKTPAPPRPADLAPWQVLGDELIEKQCGTHSLGLIYEYLRQLYGAPEKARAEFVKFLSGDWSQEWVNVAKATVESR